jgi:hypothetical protein
LERTIVVKTKKYPEIILIAITIILCIIGSVIQLSCKPTPVIPSTPILPSTALPNESQSPHKLIPAYSINIKYPSEEGFVTIKRGGSFNLQVTVRSLVDVPIKIRLALNAAGEVPEYVECELSKEYMTLNPGESINKKITIKIARDAPPGSFFLGVKGELQEPVEERGGESMNFTLTIVDG